MGKAMAHMAVVFAELERDFIRSRTREALAVRRDHGVVLGRPRSTPDDVVARVLRERTEGKTAYAIARDLNKDAVPMRKGARLVASYGPRAADAGRRSLITTVSLLATHNRHALPTMRNQKMKPAAGDTLRP
jgi:hypothetical protein